MEGSILQSHRRVSVDSTGQVATGARRTGAAFALVQTFSEGVFAMANDSGQVGFFAAAALESAAARQPQKKAIIAKEEELTFAVLNQRVQALAAHLQKEGVKQGDRVGILLPNSVAIPLSYYATQKIGAVTVILDARLRGKELQGVLGDADLKFLIVHNQLFPEVEESFRAMASVPVWIVNGDGERSFEKRFTDAPPLT